MVGTCTVFGVVTSSIFREGERLAKIPCATILPPTEFGVGDVKFEFSRFVEVGWEIYPRLQTRAIR